MKTNKNFIYILCAVLIAVLGVLIFAAYNYYFNRVEESDLFKLVSPYMAEETDWSVPDTVAYKENTGEAMFLEGMTAFAGGDYERARGIFIQAESAVYIDPALPAYLYYYVNECDYLLNGIGNYDMVEKAFDEAAKYQPLSNDNDFLWNLISTVSMTGTDDESAAEADAKAIALMEDYIMYTPNLELSTWGRMKNGIALLEYMNQEYANGIRSFYDVEYELQKAEATPEIKEELRYAREYIANIYYTFEDYERTVQLYQELIDDTADDSEAARYSYYINMATAYLEIGDLENAKKAALTLNDVIIPQLDEDIAAEIDASNKDVLAKIAVEEGNYEEANEYLESAEAFFKDNGGRIFLGAKYYVMLTRCEYMIRVGELSKAQTVLEGMKEEGSAAYYGLEKELYELLLEVYEKTGQKDKLIEVYDHMLYLDEQFVKTTQREYLAFSEYYSYIIDLENNNLILAQNNSLYVLIICICAVGIVIILVFLRLLRSKNITDQLTEVYNRKQLNILMRKYGSTGTPENLGIVMTDIDFFKHYNDTCGHPEGDRILKEVAKVLKESVRSNDTIIRYGGEEFLILLKDVQMQTAEEICRRIQKKLTERNIPHPASDTAPYITLSIGLCHQQTAGRESLEGLIEYADECLYTSKEEGRNRVTARELG